MLSRRAPLVRLGFGFVMALKKSSLSAAALVYKYIALLPAYHIGGVSQHAEG